MRTTPTIGHEPRLPGENRAHARAQSSAKIYLLVPLFLIGGPRVRHILQRGTCLFHFAAVTPSNSGGQRSRAVILQVENDGQGQWRPWAVCRQCQCRRTVSHAPGAACDFSLFRPHPASSVSFAAAGTLEPLFFFLHSQRAPPVRGRRP